MQKVISTDKAPAAIGPYSQAIEVNGMVYTSGVIPVDPSTGAIPEGGVEGQANQAFHVLKWQDCLRTFFLRLRQSVSSNNIWHI